MIDEKAFGVDHPEVATDLVHLAVSLKSQGDREGARSCFERALAIREKAFGPEHALTRDSAHFLAQALSALGHVNEAEAIRAKYDIPG